MRESAILKRVRIAASALGARVFRNNVGLAHAVDARGVHRAVRYGLCAGSSDLIGWVPVLITPDMVGRRVAVFLAVETKTRKGRVTPEQQNFLDRVAEAGGIALVARCEDDVVDGIGGWVGETG